MSPVTVPFIPLNIRQAIESDTGQRGGHSHPENVLSDKLPESAEEG